MNGDFSNGLNGWFAARLGSIENISGQLKVTSAGQPLGGGVQGVAIKAFTNYDFSVDLISTTETCWCIIGGSPDNYSPEVAARVIDSQNTAGTYTLRFATEVTTVYIWLLAPATVGGHAIFDNLSLKEVT